jgi:hypothetical protein
LDSIVVGYSEKGRERERERERIKKNECSARELPFRADMNIRSGGFISYQKKSPIALVPSYVTIGAFN